MRALIVMAQLTRVHFLHNSSPSSDAVIGHCKKVQEKNCQEKHFIEVWRIDIARELSPDIVLHSWIPLISSHISFSPFPW